MKENASPHGSKSKDLQKSHRSRSSKNSSKSSVTKKAKGSDSGVQQKQRKEHGDNQSQRKSSTSRRVVMGLDLSLTGTGMVLWDGKQILRRRRYKTEPVTGGDGLKAGPRGQLAPDRFKGDDEERIEWLRQRVTRNVKKFKPTLVVIEGHSFLSKGNAGTRLHELHGVIKNELHRTHVLFVLIAPTTNKKHFVGDGRASKVEMIHAAKKFDRGIGTDDEADAMGLADLGFRKFHEIVDDPIFED